jgi:hypothetical protein
LRAPNVKMDQLELQPSHLLQRVFEPTLKGRPQ